MIDHFNYNRDRISALLVGPTMLAGPVIAAMYPNSFISRGFLLAALGWVGATTIFRIGWRAVRISGRHLQLLGVVTLFVCSYAACLAATLPGIEADNLVKMAAPMGRLLLTMSAFAVATSFDWRCKTIRHLSCLAMLSALLPLSLVQAYNGCQTGHVFLGLHSNMLGMVGVAFSFVGAQLNLNSERSSFYFATPCVILTGVFAIIVSNSRGALLSGFLLMTATAFFQSTRRRKVIQIAAFGFLIAGCVLSPWGLERVSASSIGMAAANVSEVAFGKESIENGRENLWQRFKSELSLRPYLGYGVLSHDSYTRKLPNGKTIKLSPHNYFLAVLHEVGFVGVSIVSAFLLYVCAFAVLGRGESPLSVSLTLGFLLATLVHQCTEVSLTTGNFLLGTTIWTAIGVGTSFALRHESE